METIFRDPVWQFVGALIGIISIITSIAIVIIRRQKREITYRIISKLPLAAKVENADEQLSIYFRSRRVSDVYLYIISFKNSGNQSIKSDDYERPIAVRVTTPGRLLIGEIINTKPGSLLPEIISFDSIEFKRKIIANNPKGASNQLSIKPILLNPNDEYTLKIIISNYQTESLVIDGRIVGISEIKLAKESTRNILTAWMWLPTLIGIIFTYSLLISSSVILSTIGVIISIFGLIWIVTDTIEDIKRTWRKITKR
jgi:hypothetical protein